MLATASAQDCVPLGHSSLYFATASGQSTDAIILLLSVYFFGHIGNYNVSSPDPTQECTHTDALQPRHDASTSDDAPSSTASTSTLHSTDATSACYARPEFNY